MKAWFLYWWPWIQGTLGMSVMCFSGITKNIYLLVFGAVITIAAELTEIRIQLRAIRHAEHNSLVLEVRESLEAAGLDVQ